MSASPDPLQQRYEAIERVYSERQWDTVARLSEELLLELPDDPSHALRQRLQLLLGHTHLYGYRDAATATGFYKRVRAATEEPVLRDIAAQGLEQCASQTASAPVAQAEETPASPNAGQPFPFSAAPVQNPSPQAGGTDARPAMPWMEQLGGASTPVPVEVPDLPVEVVEEPELIELAQADHAQAEELEVAVSDARPAAVQPQPTEPANNLSPEEIAELSKGLLQVVIR